MHFFNQVCHTAGSSTEKAKEEKISICTRSNDTIEMNENVNYQEFSTHTDENQQIEKSQREFQDPFSEDNPTSEVTQSSCKSTSVSDDLPSSTKKYMNELTASTEGKNDQEDVCKIIDPVNSLLLEFLEKQKKGVEIMKEKLLIEMRNTDAEIESWSEKIVSIPAAFDLLDDPFSDNELQKDEFNRLKNKSNAALLEFTRGCLLNAKFKKVKQEKKRALLDEILLAWHIAKEFLSGGFHFGGCRMSKSLSSMGQSSPFVILSEFINQNKSRLIKEKDDLVDKIRTLETERDLWDVVKQNVENIMLRNVDDEAKSIVLPKINQFIDLEKKKVAKKEKGKLKKGFEFEIAALDGMISLWQMEEENLARAFPSVSTDISELRLPITEKLNRSCVVEDVEMIDVSENNCDVSERIGFGAKESNGFPQNGFNKNVSHIFSSFKASEPQIRLQTCARNVFNDFSPFQTSKSNSFPQLDLSFSNFPSGRCGASSSQSIFQIEYSRRISSNFPLFTTSTIGKFRSNDFRTTDSTSFPQIGFNNGESNVSALARNNANEFSFLAPTENNADKVNIISSLEASAEISSRAAQDDVPPLATSSASLDDILENPNLSFVIQSVKGFLSAPPKNNEDEEIEKHLANLSKVKEIIDSSDAYTTSSVKSNSIDDTANVGKNSVAKNKKRKLPENIFKYFEISQASDGDISSPVISNLIDGTANATNKSVKRKKGKSPQNDANTSSIVPSNSIDGTANVSNI